MTNLLKFLAIAGMLFLINCRKIPLSQHYKEYSSGKKNQSGIDFFTTTKAHLDSIWGPKQQYFYLGSDEKYHYISTQHIRLALESYRYKIPVETKIENPLFYPTFSQEFYRYKKLKFK